MRLIRGGLPVDYAMGVAEAYAKEAGAGGLINPHARWRQNPATESQLAYMRVLGVPVPPRGVSKGEAQQLIAVAKAGKAWVA